MYSMVVLIRPSWYTDTVCSGALLSGPKLVALQLETTVLADALFHKSEQARVTIRYSYSPSKTVGIAG
jgi:hypothetical protein